MRMKTNFDRVVEFNEAMGVSVFPDELPKTHELSLSATLIEEEVDELFGEVPGTVGDLKELCDLLYVVYGHAARIGYDMNTAFNRVHEANMRKLGDDGKPIYREDGKVLKGPNYQPPDLSDCLPSYCQ